MKSSHCRELSRSLLPAFTYSSSTVPLPMSKLFQTELHRIVGHLFSSCDVRHERGLFKDKTLPPQTPKKPYPHSRRAKVRRFRTLLSRPFVEKWSAFDSECSGSPSQRRDVLLQPHICRGCRRRKAITAVKRLAKRKTSHVLNRWM